MRYGSFMLAITALLAVGASAGAQSLEQRVAAVRNGAVTFHFRARPGVCGDGLHVIRTGHASYHGSWREGRPMEPCAFGPVQVKLMLEDGAVFRVQTWVGPLRDRNATGLGAVPAGDAARYLMALAARAAPRASAQAIFPAVLADSATVWPALLSIARDRDGRSRGTRQEAAMWLSRFASAAVAGHRDDPFYEPEKGGEDEELKVHAVFVLSQMSRDQGIPDLLDIARSNPNPRVRAQAMFWLGQSGDARAIELFESVLRS